MKNKINVNIVDRENRVFELKSNSDFVVLMESALQSKFTRGKLDKNLVFSTVDIASEILVLEEYHPTSMLITKNFNIFGIEFEFNDCFSVCIDTHGVEIKNLVVGNGDINLHPETASFNFIHGNLFECEISIYAKTSQKLNNEKFNISFILLCGGKEYSFEMGAIATMISSDQLDLRMIDKFNIQYK